MSGNPVLTTFHGETDADLVFQVEQIWVVLPHVRLGVRDQLADVIAHEGAARYPLYRPQAPVHALRPVHLEAVSERRNAELFLAARLKV